ncbi:MAG: 4Fe-4S dicluster domain-containing protein [candidate division Zixibacteria bacterium]
MQTGLLSTYKSNVRTRGSWAYLLSFVLFAFYVVIYWTSLFDPVAKAIGLPSRWQIYGILYTVAIIVGGIYFLKLHGNSRYHLLRTLSIIFFQVIFAFALPSTMELLNMKSFTFSTFWPLKIDYFYPSYILEYPLPLIVYAAFSSLVLVPVLTFWYGKRWYCSWVCGCGGLAETAGDSFRHLSSKSTRAWRLEKISIYSVLAFAVIGTALVIINWSTALTLHGAYSGGDRLMTIGDDRLKFPLGGKTIWQREILPADSDDEQVRWRPVASEPDVGHPGTQTGTRLILTSEGVYLISGSDDKMATVVDRSDGKTTTTTFELSVPRFPLFSKFVSKVQGMYAFVVVALLSGILGVGLYPLLGNRVWCRFFCPLAGLMGLIQKFGRFRITVKDDMCISCGNCSTYCEMGIDVRMYAQSNLDFKRAACVGCGICAHVCPRGVLRLENKFDMSPFSSISNIRTTDI